MSGVPKGSESRPPRQGGHPWGVGGAWVFLGRGRGPALSWRAADSPRGGTGLSRALLRSWWMLCLEMRSFLGNSARAARGGLSPALHAPTRVRGCFWTRPGEKPQLRGSKGAVGRSSSSRQRVCNQDGGRAHVAPDFWGLITAAETQGSGSLGPQRARAWVLSIFPLTWAWAAAAGAKEEPR